MKIKLYSRQDRYKTPIEVEFIHGNMVITKDNLLPRLNDSFPEHTSRKYIQFNYGTSYTYYHESDKVVNTRISYKAETTNGKGDMYCKLNWRQKLWLAHLIRRVLYQTNPVAFWAFVANVIFATFNIQLFSVSLC